MNKGIMFLKTELYLYLLYHNIADIGDNYRVRVVTGNTFSIEKEYSYNLDNSFFVPQEDSSELSLLSMLLQNSISFKITVPAIIEYKKLPKITIGNTTGLTNADIALLRLYLENEQFTINDSNIKPFIQISDSIKPNSYTKFREYDEEQAVVVLAEQSVLGTVTKLSPDYFVKVYTEGITVKRASELEELNTSNPYTEVL